MGNLPIELVSLRNKPGRIQNMYFCLTISTPFVLLQCLLSQLSFNRAFTHSALVIVWHSQALGGSPYTWYLDTTLDCSEDKQQDTTEITVSCKIILSKMGLRTELLRADIGPGGKCLIGPLYYMGFFYGLSPPRNLDQRDLAFPASPPTPRPGWGKTASTQVYKDVFLIQRYIWVLEFQINMLETVFSTFDLSVSGITIK